MVKLRRPKNKVLFGISTVLFIIVGLIGIRILQINIERRSAPENKPKIEQTDQNSQNQAQDSQNRPNAPAGGNGQTTTRQPAAGGGSTSGGSNTGGGGGTVDNRNELEKAIDGVTEQIPVVRDLN